MRQQINLFKPELRERRQPLDAVSLLVICLVMLVAMGAWSGYSWWHVQGLEEKKTRTLAELEGMREQVAVLEARRREAASPSQLLETELQRVRKELDERRQVVDSLRGGTFRNTEGFSNSFEAFARQHEEGSWLTRIRIGDGGNFVSLKGETHAPELVPAYLERLMKEKDFSDLSFNTLELKVSEQEASRLSFEVATASGRSASDESS